MYWRPRRVSQTALLLIAALSAAGYAVVVNVRIKSQEPYYADKRRAAEIAAKAFRIIRDEHVARNLLIDAETDPAQSGLIGYSVTPVTTNTGSLSSKQTSINPNFAAIVIKFLKDLRLRPDDTVAIGYSGSFPALNIAVLSAVSALRLKPVIISSASSSQWGANEPSFLWLDMEKTLADRGLFAFRSAAASIGGIEDRGLGITKEGQTLLKKAIDRHEVAFIEPGEFSDSIDERMRRYRELAGTSSIRAYINVGGGAVSVGRRTGKRTFNVGVNRTNPAVSLPTDSVMGRMLTEGIPVVHIVNVKKLAERYGLPEAPQTTPAVGSGAIFVRTRISRVFVAILLFVVLGALYLFVRSDLGFRMVRLPTRSRRPSPPEQMV